MSKRWLHLLLIAGAVVVTYGPVLRAGFMYDDRFFVQENPAIRHWSSAPSFFTAPVTSQASLAWQGIWRPLRSLSYLLDHQLWGLDPAAFHRTNVALHAANACLFYFLVLLLSGNAAAALAAALLFALHPAQTEAVAWISSRGDLLFALFALGSLILYQLTKRRHRALLLAGSLLCFVLAMLAKETAIVLPALLMLTDRLMPGDDRTGMVPQRWVAYALFWSLAIIYFITRRVVLGAAGQCPYWGDSFFTTLFTMVRVAADYVRLVVWPWPLHVDYVYALSTTLLDWRVIGCALLLAGLTLLAVLDLRGQRTFAWAWGWFAIALLPVSNLIPITALLAERFLYLPLMGIAAWAALRWSALPKNRIRCLPLALVLCVFAGLSIKRNLEWRDPLTFWQAEARREPRSFIAQGYLGGLYLEQGRADSAEVHYLRSAAIEPRYAVAQAGLARLYADRGAYPLALQHIMTWLAVLPDDAEAWSLRGICSAGAGDYQVAELSFEQAVRLRPGLRDAWFNLGLLYQLQRRPGEAVGAFQRAIELSGSDSAALEARVDAAIAAEQVDRTAAVAAWGEALRFARRKSLPVNQQYIERRIERLRDDGKK